MRVETQGHSQDGHFVPNLSFGIPEVQALRKHSKAFLDCHLMVSKPEQWVSEFGKIGVDQYTFHLEATSALGCQRFRSCFAALIQTMWMR